MNSKVDVVQVRQEGCDVWLCMADPSNNPDHPGWPLRNMLLLAAKRWQVTTLSVLCVRDQRGKLDPARSLCLSVVLPPIPSGTMYTSCIQVRSSRVSFSEDAQKVSHNVDTAKQILGCVPDPDGLYCLQVPEAYHHIEQA